MIFSPSFDARPKSIQPAVRYCAHVHHDDTCYDFVPYLVTWTVVGYVDKSTRLMFNTSGSPSNHSAGSVYDLQGITELVLFQAGASIPLQGKEQFAYTVRLKDQVMVTTLGTLVPVSSTIQNCKNSKVTLESSCTRWKYMM
jgi:hypothetical protein